MRNRRDQHALGVGLFAAISLIASFAGAEDVKTLPKVTYNLDLHVFEQVLPHRTPFFIELSLAKEYVDYNQIKVVYRRADGGQCPSKAIASQGPATADEGTIAGSVGEVVDKKRTALVAMPKIRYSTNYCFWFQLSHKWSDTETQNVKDAAAKAVAAAAKQSAYDEALVKTSLEAVLGSKAGMMVVPAGGGKETPLGEVLFDNFYTRAALQPVFDAWRDYHFAEGNALAWSKKLRLLDVKAPPKAAFAKQPLVKQLEASYASTLEAATNAGFGADLSAAQVTERKSAAPTTSAEARDYRARVEVLQKHADELRKDLCPSPGAAKPKLSASAEYCAVVERIATPANKESTTISADLLTTLDGMAAANATYVAKQSDIVKSLKAYVDVLRNDVRVTDVTSYEPTFTERSSFYISADLGGVVPIFPGGGADVAIFLGANLYFTGVDKDVPLLQDDGFWKRFSISAGVTLTSVKDSTGTATGIMSATQAGGGFSGGNGIMVGGGFRLTDYLRLGSGAMFVRQKDANPLVADTHVRLVPYLSLSLDVDVVGTIQSAYAKYK